MVDLNDSVALVTGGASGLGEGTVRRLHAAGAGVVIFDKNAERGPPSPRSWASGRRSPTAT